MKKSIFTVAALSGIALMFNACGGSQPAPDNAASESSAISADYNIDAATSSVDWKGVMLGIKDHTGGVAITEGNFKVEAGKVVAANVTVDLTKISITDSNYDAQSTPDKLVGHLQSPDFFDVANHPTAKFVTRGTDANGNILGELTVRGITNAETVTNVSFDAATGTASGTLTFDRKKYNVSFDVPMKDMVISNDIVLNIRLKASK